MNNKKNAYEEKIDAQLKERRAELDKLKAQGNQIKADAKIEYQKKIDQLESEQESLKKKADEIKSASEESWADLKSGFSDAWDRMSKSLDDARSNF